MIPVEQFEIDGCRTMHLSNGLPECSPLPVLLFPDGALLTEWTFTDAERAAVAKGENLRLWVWTYGQPLQPVALELTDERKG